MTCKFNLCLQIPKDDQYAEEALQRILNGPKKAGMLTLEISKSLIFSEL